MKSPQRVIVPSLLALFVMAGCEKPQQRTATSADEPAAPAMEVVAPAPAPLATSAPVSAPAPPLAPATSPDAAADKVATAGTDPEPELRVARVGEKIHVQGALRSKIQVERIVETLQREFPDAEIENTLVVDYDRMGVGWGNRIADEFLVPFLSQVEDAKIVYHETVVTLDGKVKSAGTLQHLSETAIAAFSGSTTSDLRNNLKVTASANP